MPKSSIAGARYEVETGFVGFFDILGYRSFLASGISEVTFRVIDILDSLPSRLEIELNKHYGLDRMSQAEISRNPLFSNLPVQLSRIQPLVVSDSILLRCAYDNSSKSTNPSQAVTFLLAACVLQRVMFDEGLPLRGSIAFGDFIFVNQVFAGKPIIDAYDLGQNLDLAGTVIHETAEREFDRLIKEDSRWEEFLSERIGGGISWLLRYLTPIKNAEARSLYCLNSAWPTLSGTLNQTDLQRYVQDRFLAHNKTLNKSAGEKLEKTIAFFKFLANRWPPLFNRDP